MEILVRYLRYTDGKVDDVELTANGVKLTISIDEMKGLVRQYDLFTEQENAKRAAMHKCTDCRYCVTKDEGYSNYTVEGTTVDCMLMLNPGFPKDNFYGEEDFLLHANKCSLFSKGEHPHVDVEEEEFDADELPRELAVLYDAWLLRGAA
jgi:hypothetical protein